MVFCLLRIGQSRASSGLSDGLSGRRLTAESTPTSNGIVGTSMSACRRRSFLFRRIFLHAFAVGSEKSQEQKARSTRKYVVLSLPRTSYVVLLNCCCCYVVVLVAGPSSFASLCGVPHTAQRRERWRTPYVKSHHDNSRGRGFVWVQPRYLQQSYSYSYRVQSTEDIRLDDACCNSSRGVRCKHHAFSEGSHLSTPKPHPKN